MDLKIRPYTRNQQTNSRQQVFMTTCLTAGLIFLIGLSGLTGCSRIMRGQSPDNEGIEFDEDLEEQVYVGEMATPSGLEMLKLEGLGLLNQLDGTGSEPPAGPQRKELVAEIQTHEIQDVTGLLARDDNSMVVLLGLVPPGARKGDRFDVSVNILNNSDTTSLDGGNLLPARMKPFIAVTGNRVKKGHNTALAQGRLVVDSVFETGDQQAKNLSGVIPGGGVVTRERPMRIVIHPEYRSVRAAASIARSLNRRFSTRVSGAPAGVANPVSDASIEILMPEEYRHNLGRYFNVVLNMAYDETPERLVNRLELLERELHDPEKASVAAVRLEAIGDGGTSILKRGLRATDFPVRFHSAEALAYLGDSVGVKVLQEAVDSHPTYRWHALTALMSMGGGKAEEVLTELFSSESSEARYGAFRALRKGIPDSFMVDGEFVGREFMLHTVPSFSRPMIHISRQEVAEVVIFGPDNHFGPGMLFVDSGLTIRAHEDGIEVKRFLPGGREQRVLCSTLVSDVIRNMVKLGANYGDVVRMLKESRQSEALKSQLVIDAVPKLENSYRAIDSGTNSVDSLTADPSHGPEGSSHSGNSDNGPPVQPVDVAISPAGLRALEGLERKNSGGKAGGIFDKLKGLGER